MNNKNNNTKSAGNTVIFESGATSHQVDSLILWADNTQELAALRDQIYTAALKTANTKEADKLLKTEFWSLLMATIDNYIKANKDDNDTIKEIRSLTTKQKTEFCQIYANEFKNWLYEYSYYSLKELKEMPTVHQGHAENIKIDTPVYRLLISRMTIADGAEYDNEVTALIYNGQEWETLRTYEAK